MNFDHLARHYDWLEAVTAGSRLQRVRTQWLDAVAGRRRLLSAGEGHGRFASACARRFPDLEMTCVESSQAMLARARKRLGSFSTRIQWENTDLLNWTSPIKFDVIATCFFLDCFPASTLAEIVAKLAGNATDDALWLIADFAVPSTGLARWRAQFVHKLMYAFFRVTAALPASRFIAPDEFLKAHGFQLISRREFEWGLLRADLWRRDARPSLNARRHPSV